MEPVTYDEFMALTITVSLAFGVVGSLIGWLLKKGGAYDGIR
jgi:hypothetical protein